MEKQTDKTGIRKFLDREDITLDEIKSLVEALLEKIVYLEMAVKELEKKLI